MSTVKRHGKHLIKTSGAHKKVWCSYAAAWSYTCKCSLHTGMPTLATQGPNNTHKRAPTHLPWQYNITVIDACGLPELSGLTRQVLADNHTQCDSTYGVTCHSYVHVTHVNTPSYCCLHNTILESVWQFLLGSHGRKVYFLLCSVW